MQKWSSKEIERANTVLSACIAIDKRFVNIAEKASRHTGEVFLIGYLMDEIESIIAEHSQNPIFKKQIWSKKCDAYYNLLVAMQIRTPFYQMQKARKESGRKPSNKITSLFSAGMRFDIMQRDGYKCVICGRTAKDGIKLHVDHVHPKSKGGLATMENGVTLCNECNIGKKDRLPDGEYLKAVNAT